MSSANRIEPIAPREGRGPAAIPAVTRRPSEREAGEKQRPRPKKQSVPQPPDPGEGHLDIRA